MKEEIWKPVPTYEDYKVSNLGRVKTPNGRITLGSISGNGYRNITVRKANFKRLFKVHQMVMRAFVGPYPAGKEINHINGIKADNRLENLEYVTRSQNIRHAYSLGLNKPRKGMLNGRAKLVELDVLAIICLRSNGFRDKYISEVFGVSDSTVQAVGSGQNWGHIDWAKFKEGKK